MTENFNSADSKAKTASKPEKFLWWCAGADSELLSGPCPPSDRAKYFGMGGVVLATGILAGLSSGFGFYTIFGPKGDAVKSTAEGLVNFGEATDYISAVAAIFFGILWGLMIFNLDRFIVSSGGKGDMKEGFTFFGKDSDLYQSWPRFLMAIILGIIISKPLEVRIMKTEIDAELSTRQEIYEADQNKLSDKLIDAEIATLRTYIVPLEKTKSDNQAYVEKRRLEIKEQRKQLELEAEGKTASRSPGRGPAWQDKKQNLDKMEVELEKLAIKYGEDEKGINSRIQGYEKQIALKEAGREERHKKNKERAAQLDGLIQRVTIGHEKFPVMSYFLSIMFIIIEITPLLFKMMMTKTPYDYLSSNKDAIILANNGIVLYSEPHRDASGKEVVTPVLVNAEIINHKKLREKEIIKEQIDNFSSNQGA
jgi:hypothetical protein